jgi:mannosyl-3-phosphoglycerate phosphatase family protein
MKPIVFTDLDGSLLDHESYSCEEARPALNLLQKKNIPVIPNTSKTMAELLPIRESIGNHDPFIVENGAAIYIPEGYFKDQPKGTKTITFKGEKFWEFSQAYPRSHWTHLLMKINWRYPDDYISFSQLGVSGILKCTGLSLEESIQANERKFSEPILWLGKQQAKKNFIHSVRAAGAEVVEGGRFMHIIDASTDKASAMNKLIDFFSQHDQQSKLKSIALGDSKNDVSMLNTADFAAVIKSPFHSRPPVERDEGIYISSGFGPKGWNQVIQKILTEHFIEQ